jgi:hypothetical protein
MPLGQQLQQHNRYAQRITCCYIYACIVKSCRMNHFGLKSRVDTISSVLTVQHSTALCLPPKHAAVLHTFPTCQFLCMLCRATAFHLSIYCNRHCIITACRSLPVHQQEVTDEQGRRRFHGAFTGGFSAGYYNTVGSKVRQQQKVVGSSAAAARPAVIDTGLLSWLLQHSQVKGAAAAKGC